MLNHVEAFISMMEDICWFNQTSPCLRPMMKSSSRRLRSSWAPTSASSAPPGLRIQEVPSSSSSPPPAQRSTTSFQLSHIGSFSCFLLQKTSTEGRTPVFTTSTFSPITSPPPAGRSISSPQGASESRREI